MMSVPFFDVLILCVKMISVVMLSAVMLSAVILNIVAPRGVVTAFALGTLSNKTQRKIDYILLTKKQCFAVSSITINKPSTFDMIYPNKTIYLNEMSMLL